MSKATGKGGKARPIPVPPKVWEAFTVYRAAFRLPPLPEPGEKLGLILSPRTKAVKPGSTEFMSTGSRRFFGSWREVKTRQGLWSIVKGRFRQAAEVLEARGERGAAVELRQASTHWLRSTRLRQGKHHWCLATSMRTVAGALGHSDMSTTMRYTQQEAQDLITAWEQVSAGSVAGEGTAIV